MATEILSIIMLKLLPREEGKMLKYDSGQWVEDCTKIKSMAVESFRTLFSFYGVGGDYKDILVLGRVQATCLSRS